MIIDAGEPNRYLVQVPSLLALGAVHQRLIAARLRSDTSLVVISDDARDTHSVAALLGYGADAVCPRLALQTVASEADEADTGALFVGRSLGRHKMAPSISPGKTWEGSIGGLAFSVIGGGLFGFWLHLPLVHTFILAFLCGASGQIGDLCESALKRDLGIKDIGAVMPGHGGILDRIDSMLFSAPLAYYYFMFFLIARH